MVAVSVEVLQLFEGTTLKQHGSITSEEILEAMLMFGRNPRVKIIDITEFNPSVEDYNSSLLILNMIYYYLLGFASK
jgi:formiminoglutamase